MFTSRRRQEHAGFNYPLRLNMNWDRIEGNWKQVKGLAIEKWGKLTDDDVDVVAGRRDQLAGKIQERYGMAKADAEKQVADWQRTATDKWFAHGDEHKS
jgi:uncharacterized protein YjbJ (UPF0337 family)